MLYMGKNGRVTRAYSTLGDDVTWTASRSGSSIRLPSSDELVRFVPIIGSRWLAQLVPNAKHITNTNSSYEIRKEPPQLVIDMIRVVVDALRSVQSVTLAVLDGTSGEGTSRP